MAKKRIAERRSLVGRGAVDWLTLTTQNADTYRSLIDIISVHADANEQEKPVRLLGYEGWQKGAYIYAERDVSKDTTEWLITASGADADKLVSAMVESPTAWHNVSVSRIDLQITLPPKTDRTRLASLGGDYHDGKLGEFEGRGRPKVWSIYGDDGDTLYIGSPSSDKMIRWYDKPIIVGRKRETYERMEAQYRRKKAKAAWSKIIRNRKALDRHMIERILAGEYNRLPPGMANELAAGALLGERFPESALVETDLEQSHKVRWALSLERALLELAGRSDDGGMAVRTMLLRVLVTASSHDIYSNPGTYKVVDDNGEVVEVLDIFAEPL